MDIPEPANVKMIVSDFALMVSESKTIVTSIGILCSNSIIQMLHTSASFLVTFTIR
jgi:hypothetical protein